ncbi:MAG: hypothetical protein C0417_11515 [Chlorobiaceae bacterium]|nr:hypothetical protein [Chlorobiaceae bacterium]
MYHAVIYGTPAESEFTIDLPLRTNGDRQHRTIVDFISGKPAQTSISVIKVQAGISFVSACPRTGYTHQIRSHLYAIGSPVVGDNLYRIGRLAANSPINDQIQRLALHSYKITFRHPATHLDMTFTAGYPDDFSMVLSYLQ